MALLLAMYQKMKLVREKNQVSYQLANYTTKVERISKNIERAQKRYESLFAKLDKESKMAESNAKNYWTQMGNGAGLGGSIFGGMTDIAGSLVATVFQKQFGGDYNAEMQNFQNLDQDGKSAFLQKQNYAQQIANQMIQTNQQWTNNMMQQAVTNIQARLEMKQAQLEAEQDAVLTPLQYEETMMTLEKEQAQARLERIKANLETYTQLASEEAKNSAPTFGLG